MAKEKKEKKNKMEGQDIQDIQEVVNNLPDDAKFEIEKPVEEENTEFEVPKQEEKKVEAPKQEEKKTASTDDISKLSKIYAYFVGAKADKDILLKRKFKIVKDAWTQRKPKYPFPGYDDALKILDEEL